MRMCMCVYCPGRLWATVTGVGLCAYACGWVRVRVGVWGNGCVGGVQGKAKKGRQG